MPDSNPPPAPRDHGNDDLDLAPTELSRTIYGNAADSGIDGNTIDHDPTVPGFRPDLRVFGRYTLRRVLGRGGMGVVWLAHDEDLDCDIALKFLPETVALDKQAVRDLKRETLLSRELTHPNILRIHDFLQDEHHAAISMEFVDGDSLAAYKADRPAGHYEVADLRDWVRQLCAALDHAHTHARRVVHRDLKPGNLMVNRAGTLKVTDFGIAATLTDATTRLSKTIGAGGSSGTPVYMSPQQMLGEPTAVTDDIYALGATLYDLLTGKPPFHTGRVDMQVLQKIAPSLAARRAELDIGGEPIPSEWEATIGACLAKDAADRPQSAGEVVQRLELKGVPTKATNDAKVVSGLDKPPASSVGPIPELPESVPLAGGKAPPQELPQRGAKKRQSRSGLWLATVAAIAVAAFGGWWGMNQPVAGLAEPGPGSTTPATGNPATTEVFTAPVVLPREFTLTVDPADVGARVWLGPQADVRVPTSGQLTLSELPDGEHELIVQAAGYQPFTAPVTVAAGRGTIEALLVPIKGAVEVSARPGTLVTVTDAHGRVTPVGTVNPSGTLALDNVLTIGSYTFAFAHEDCEPVTQQAELQIGRPLRLEPTQQPLPGELRVFSVPSGANVQINGVVEGTTPLTLPQLPSEANLDVEVSLAGFSNQTDSLELRPAEIRTLNFGTLTRASESVPDDSARNIPAFKRTVDYAVQSGDTGAKIARGYGMSFSDLRNVNPSVDWNRLRVGQTIQVFQDIDRVEDYPAEEEMGDRFDARLYVVKSGDTGSKIARILGVSLTALMTSNPEVKWNRLAVGQEIRIPVQGQETSIRSPYPQAGQGYENSLGMKFVPVPGTNVLFSIWETREQDYAAFVQATGRPWSNATAGVAHPAVNVSWEDAQAFCQWLTQQDRQAGKLGPNQSYRLPTDAEWSVAVGLPNEPGSSPAEKDEKVDNQFPWGTEWPPPRGAGNYHSSLNVDSFDRTVPVGSFAANRHGLHDMGGNVWEWVEDRYGSSNSNRVVRGASFYDRVRVSLLSSYRSYSPPDDRLGSSGFRVVVAAGSSVR